MNRIDIPTRDIVPLDSIAVGVVGLRVLFVNAFAIATDTGWTLVDATLSGSAGRIRRWAHTHFGDTPPHAIVLTHAHFDHVGALDRPSGSLGRAGLRARRRASRAAGVSATDPSVGDDMMSRMAGLYSRGPIELGKQLQVLRGGGVIPKLPRGQWIHTPGHTAGYVSLFRPADRTLIAGDAFCTTKAESLLAVATHGPELHGPPTYFISAWDAARQSGRRLARLEPSFIATGHGRPIANPDAAHKLHELAERFDEVRAPANRR